MSLWKHSDFMKLWVGQTVSEIGSRITREGLPMGAVLMLGVSPLTMSGLSLVTRLPASLFGLFIGVWVDRLRRRTLLIGADLGRAVLLFAIPFAAATGQLHLWLFYVVAALTGVLSLLFDVSYQAYLPWLIDRRNLVEGNSKLGVTSSAAEVLGPGLTGMLVQVFTAPMAITFDSLSYVFSATAVWSIRAKEGTATDSRFRPDARAVRQADLDTDPQADLHAKLRNWRMEMSDGLRVVRRNRILFALTGAAATSGFASSAIFVLDTLYALRTLHLTAFLFGLTITMGGIGSLVGAAFCNSAVRRFGAGKTMIVSICIQGLAATCWVFAGGSVWRSMLFLLAWQLFGDASGTIYGILDVTLRQTLVSDELLGRTNATIRVFEVGFTAVGSLVAGILGEAIGIRATFAIASVGMLLTTFWLILSPIRSVHNI